MGLSMCKAQSKESSAVFEALKSISFEGVSGTVAFNEYGTRAADTALADHCQYSIRERGYRIRASWSD